jgi:microcystin-dependent protein
MSNPFVAEIRIFAGNFAPTGWAQCNGQLLPISQNTALFSLLGTFYGGDGKSTFALPNLQGSVAIGQGQGSGLSDRFIGEQGGEESVTLLQSEIPLHNHTMMAAAGDEHESNIATDNAMTRSSLNVYAAPGAVVQAAAQELAPAGGSLPHNNMMPFLTLTYIIAMQGVFPQRS